MRVVKSMKKFLISEFELNIFIKIASEITLSDKFQREKNYYAHGNTTVFDHSINVAFLSFCKALHSNRQIDYYSLVRGALLHDYYLYDWHKNKKFTFHGLKHHKIALKNAMQDFSLNETEQNIILSHMFPLTLFHIPKNTEARIVCLMDKRAAIQEHKRRIYE
jgi:uncharacterized protein